MPVEFNIARVCLQLGTFGCKEMARRANKRAGDADFNDEVYRTLSRAKDATEAASIATEMIFGGY